MTRSRSLFAPPLPEPVAIAPTGASLKSVERLRSAVFAVDGVRRPLPPANSVQSWRYTDTAPAAGNRAGERSVSVTVEAVPLPAQRIETRFPAPSHAPYAVRPWLTPSALIPSDSPEIVALARRASGKDNDFGRSVARLVGFVRDAVTLDPAAPVVGGRRSFIAIRKDGRGGAQDIAVYLVTLARAAGIPARVCGGLVFDGENFVAHAWPEVYVGDGVWSALDPARGGFIADATHIKLTDNAVVDGLWLIEQTPHLLVRVIEAR